MSLNINKIKFLIKKIIKFFTYYFYYLKITWLNALNFQDKLIVFSPKRYSHLNLRKEKIFCVSGKFHRKNGPAIIRHVNLNKGDVLNYMHKKYYFHRIDGCDNVYSNTSKSVVGDTWCFKGTVYREEDYWNQ